MGYYNFNASRTKSFPVFVDWVEMEGPFFTPNNSPGFKLLSGQNLDKMSRDQVTSLIREFAQLAFRHKSPSDDFLTALNKHYDFLLTNSKDQKLSIIKSLAAILSTPHFLYISEYNTSNERKVVSGHELANRLSFFLWSSVPDKALLEKADRLSDHGVLTAEVDRMLSSPKAENFYENFTSQWLGTDKIETLTPPKRYSNFAAAKYEIMKEPQELMKYLVGKNLSAANFINSDFLVINPMLARYYNLPRKNSVDGFSKYQLTDKSDRGGLLGQSSILTITSRPDRTSPIDRGAYILRKLLNSPPPEPPANVPDADFEAKGKTMREILELHQSKAQCSSCHRKIDPLGFAMEKFNQFGLMKSAREARNVDTSGKMPDGQRTFKDFNEMKKLLVDDKEKFIEGLSKSLMSYALGRTISFTDDQRIQEIISKGRKNNFAMRDLIKEIVLSDQFLKK